MSKNTTIWSAVDRYYNALFVPADAALEASFRDSATADMPPHNV